MKKKGVVVCKLEKKGLYSEVYIYKMLDDEEEEEEKGETVLRAFFFFSNCFWLYRVQMVLGGKA